MPLNDIDKLEAKLAKIDKERQGLFAAMQPLQDQSKKLYDKRAVLVQQISELKSADILMSGERDWPKLLDGNDDTLYSVFGRIINSYGCLYPSGVYCDTNQRAVKLKFCKENEDEIDVAYNFIKDVAPYYMATDKNNNISFSLFEETLSEYGIYRLDVNKSNIENSSLCITSHYTDRKIKDFTSLKEALGYIQQHYYYNSLEKDKARDECSY